MIIALCSSVTFYPKVAQLKNELQKFGHTVFVPELADRMERENNYEVDAYMEEYSSDDPERKKGFIMAHFKIIEKSDAILVVNETKHGVEGYIGPNVLMEMGIAFYLGKKIVVLNPILKEKCFAYDEVMSMGAVFLEGKVDKVI